MIAQRKEMAEFVGPNHSKGLSHCGACNNWVRPEYHGQVVPSNRLNIPGLAGRYVNVACCSQCGENL